MGGWKQFEIEFEEQERSEYKELKEINLEEIITGMEEEIEEKKT